MRTTTFAASFLAMAAAGCDQAAAHLQRGLHQAADQHAAQSGSTTFDLRGVAEHERTWAENPSMHAFFELTVATLGKGTEKIDFPAYQQKSYAIFREFGASMGWKPEAMVDHLKDVPRQMVGIVKDDPKVLDSYDKFKIALAGPP